MKQTGQVSSVNCAKCSISLVPEVKCVNIVCKLLQLLGTQTAYGGFGPARTPLDDGFRPQPDRWLRFIVSFLVDYRHW